MSKSHKPHKPHKQPHNRPVPVLPAKPSGNNARRIILLGFGMLLAFGATWALMEFVVWNKLPSALVGKWVVKDGEQEGATFDFFRDGRMIANINNRGNHDIINAQVTVDGELLLITTQHPVTKAEMTKKFLVKTLSANYLVLDDEQKVTWRMERAN